MSTLSQRNFSAGEIAPALYPRVDTAKRLAGARTVRNTVVMRHGGTASRPGTKWVAEVKDSTKHVRLIPFVFNSSQTYMLEFGNLYMRVHKAGVQLSTAVGSITGITQANPAVVTLTAHGLSNGQEVSISGVNGMTQVNGRNFKVAGVTANTFQLQDLGGTGVNSTGYSAYASGGTTTLVYEIATPYAEADLPTLEFVQSADVITIAHPSYPPQEVKRTGDTAWTIGAITFQPSVNTPTIFSLTSSPGLVAQYVVTAISGTYGDESFASTSAGSTNAATAGSPNTLTWGLITGASQYNVYRLTNGIYGLIAEVGGGANGLVDVGADADISKTPPINPNLFAGSNAYPSTVTYFQQRLLFANTNTAPETVWASRTGVFKNFTGSEPVQASDAINFTLVSRRANAIRHMVDLGRLLVLTAGGEWSINGDGSGSLTPTEINARQYSYYGSSTLPPLVIGNNALFVQARGSVIRDLTYEFQSDAYRGNELTIYSPHLVEGYTLTDWTYQQIPHSIVWAVRSDGVLLGLTYVKEQQVLGWHRHDTDGTVENVCAIPEGSEDVVYLVVKRTVNGRSVRYIEQMQTRFITTMSDFTGMDCSLAYDGRNTSATTVAATGGSTWDQNDNFSLTASTGVFTASDVGKWILLTSADGKITSLAITSYVNNIKVNVTPNTTLPVSLRGVTTSAWARAASSISGLWHLEGKTISVLGDGYVVASPNNPAYNALTVTNGSVTLDKPYGVIRAGLPYTCDLETLDVDSEQSETIVERKKNVCRVTLQVEKSAGIWVGGKAPDNDAIDPLQNLDEKRKYRPVGTGYGPAPLETGPIEVNIESHWSKGGRVFIRQVDPIPLSVLSVHGSGYFPFRQQGA